MDFGLSRINLFPKKFIPYEQMEDNFLQFLLGLSDSSYASIFPRTGVSSGCVLGSVAPDTFSISTPAKFYSKTAQGIRLASSAIPVPYVFNDIPFENALGVDYHVGLKHLELPVDPIPNVRTGLILFDRKQQTVGEMVEPDAVTDLGGGQLKILVNTVVKSLTPNLASHAGRPCLIWLKSPVSAVLAVETLLIQWDGTNNFVVATYMGQEVPSTTAADYMAAVVGPTVSKDAGMAVDPEYTYMGIVTGAGAGNTPTIFDVSGQYHYPASPGVAVNDLWTVYQDLYTTPSMDGDGLPNLLHPIQSALALEHYDVSDVTHWGRHKDVEPDTITMHIQTGLQMTFQAFDVADKLNQKLQFKDNTGLVRAWVDGDGNAQFQDVHVMGTEYIHESEIIDGDFTVLGNLTAGNDVLVDQFYGHLLLATFDKDLTVGQDLRVNRHSYLGNDVMDRVQVGGAFLNQVRFLNEARFLAPSPSTDYLDIQAVVNGAAFSTNDTNESWFTFINWGTGGSVLSAQKLNASGNVFLNSANPLLEFGTTNSFDFYKANDNLFNIQSNLAADTTIWLSNLHATGKMHLQVEGSIQLDGQLYGATQLQFNDAFLLSPKPLPLAGAGAANQTYNGAATTLIGALNECLSSGTLDWNYDAGGSGLGRTIVADSGAVEISRQSHAVVLNLANTPPRAGFVSGLNWSNYYVVGQPVNIILNITGSALGNNGWYIGSPSSATQLLLSTNVPGGTESGVVATWYEISNLSFGVARTRTLEAFADYPTDSISSWSIASNGDARWGIDPTSFIVVHDSENINWKWFGKSPSFDLFDTNNPVTPTNIRIAQFGGALHIQDGIRVSHISYDLSTSFLTGHSMSRGINFVDPVNAQDLATKAYVDWGDLGGVGRQGYVYGLNYRPGSYNGQPISSIQVQGGMVWFNGTRKYRPQGAPIYPNMANVYNPATSTWGRRSGEALAAGWWYVYATMDTITSEWGIAFSMLGPSTENLAHPSQPAWRWIGCIWTNGSGFVREFHRTPSGDVTWVNYVNGWTTIPVLIAIMDLSLEVPSQLQAVMAKITVQIITTSAQSSTVYFASIPNTGSPTSKAVSACAGGNNSIDMCEGIVYSSSIYMSCSNTGSPTVRYAVNGYRENINANVW